MIVHRDRPLAWISPRMVDFVSSAEKKAFQTKQATAVDEMRAKQLELQDRLEELEATRSSPGATGPARGSVAQREAADHTKAFLAWMRRPSDSTRKTELENVQTAIEKKATSVLIGTPSAGGYVVPEEIRREIERLELKFSPVRSLVNVWPGFVIGHKGEPPIPQGSSVKGRRRGSLLALNLAADLLEQHGRARNRSGPLRFTPPVARSRCSLASSSSAAHESHRQPATEGESPRP